MVVPGVAAQTAALPIAHSGVIGIGNGRAVDEYAQEPRTHIPIIDDTLATHIGYGLAGRVDHLGAVQRASEAGEVPGVEAHTDAAAIAHGGPVGIGDVGAVDERTHHRVARIDPPVTHQASTLQIADFGAVGIGHPRAVYVAGLGGAVPVKLRTAAAAARCCGHVRAGLRDC